MANAYKPVVTSKLLATVEDSRTNLDFLRVNYRTGSVNAPSVYCPDERLVGSKYRIELTTKRSFYKVTQNFGSVQTLPTAEMKKIGTNLKVKFGTESERFI